jgi:hypothetical protein
MSIWGSNEYMLIRFLIQDGERSYFSFHISHKDNFPAPYDHNDRLLIDMHVGNVTDYSEKHEMYWINGMSTLCKVSLCTPMNDKIKELFNSYGVY